MKVSFNPIVNANNFGRISQGVSVQQKQNIAEPDGDNTTSLPLIAYRPVNFKAKPDANFIITQTENICAYTRKSTLPSYALRSIYAKLAKKTNAQAAINFLEGYKNYMPAVEAEVFDFLKENSDGGKKTFQDILYEKRYDSLDKLRSRQALILGSDETDRIISDLDGHSRDYVARMRDSAMYQIYDANSSFSRHGLLRQIESIQTNEENLAKLEELYGLWYQLPRSFIDFDAFVMKYYSAPHDVIAQRLISMSEKTVEHVIPTARDGEDALINMVPAMKLINNDRGDMRLDVYAARNPEFEISKNLQRYADDIADDIASGDSPFIRKEGYLKGFAKTVAQETNGEFKIKVKEPKPQRVKNSKLTSSQRGRYRYVSYRR